MRRLAVLLAGLLAAASASAQEVQSILVGADPSIENFDGSLWIYPTGPGDRLQSWRATDGTWTPQSDLVALGEIAWVGDDRAPTHYLWAPDMVRLGQQYLLYYSVGPQDPTPSRLGVATCSSPAGPCTDSGKPLLTGGDGFEAIDPMVFEDPRSALRYLYAGGSNGATLRVFVLSEDGLTIAREVPIDQPQNFTEGAFMHQRDGVYYLSYSDGKWNHASYSVHYSTAPSPTGPWTYRGVLLQTTHRFKGPGHHSFVQLSHGAWMIAYHRWEGSDGDGPYTGHRRVALQPVTYLPDGAIALIVMSER